MSEQEQVIENETKIVEQKKGFNPDDFTTKAKGAAEPTKQEPTIIEQNNNAPIEPIVETTTTTTTTPTTEDSEFEVTFDDILLDTTTQPKKPIYDLLKEIDPELQDEDTAVSSYKTLKEENEKLKIIAKGRSLIDNDQDIINWTKMTKLSQEDKAKSALYFEYIQKGYEHEDAKSRAEEDFTELSELKPRAIEDKATEYNALVKRNIEAKTKFIENQILENNVDLNVEDKVLSQVEKNILETTEFLGMTLPKDEAKRAKVLKDAVDFAKSAEFKKELKDPKVLSEFVMYRKYKDNWTNNIKQKGVSKVAVVEKMANAPAVTPTKGNHAVKTDKPSGFNPQGWK